MNRLLFVPFLASCLGFVFLAGSGSVEKESGASEMSKGSGVIPKEDVQMLKSAEQIQNDLLDRWNHYRESKRTFSRVYRPERYQTPGILVNDTLPSPPGSFVGVFTLLDQEPGATLAVNENIEVKQKESMKLEFPIVVDRRTGDAMVFAAGQWSDFSQWAVSAN